MNILSNIDNLKIIRKYARIINILTDMLGGRKILLKSRISEEFLPYSKNRIRKAIKDEIKFFRAISGIPEETRRRINLKADFGDNNIIDMADIYIDGLKDGLNLLKIFKSI